MDITLTGYIENMRVTRDKNTAFVYFSLESKGSDSVMKSIGCYMVTSKDISKTISNMDKTKEFCIEGCICSDEKLTEIQVHAIYYKPEKIYA